MGAILFKNGSCCVCGYLTSTFCDVCQRYVCPEHAIVVHPSYDQTMHYCEHCYKTSPKVKKEDDRCFIATAAYGTPLAEEIMVLRRFRDTVLLPSKIGRRFVNWYYQVSPPLAKFISRFWLLKALVRLALWPVVRLVRLC